jgi:hypothetical protein
MEHKMSIFALALSGALVASASAYAAGADNSSISPWQSAAAIMGPSVAYSGSGQQRDVIDPPSSIDPGMTIDPPQTGARMPIIHPPGTEPGGRLILPR